MSFSRLAAFIAVGVLFAAPAQAQKPADDKMPPITGPAAPAPLQPGDAFGTEVTLPERTIVYMQGHSNWDTAFDTIVDAFKSLNEYLAKQGLKPNGPAMTIYTKTDDTGFDFRAAFPIAAPASESRTSDRIAAPSSFPSRTRRAAP